MSVRRLEAVVVCVDYSDFLAETLPHNMTQFDRIVVVTSPEDVETKQLCSHLSVECRDTDLIYKDRRDAHELLDTLGVSPAGRPARGGFSKSRAIDYGLAYLQSDDFLVQLDCDIWLPPMFRNWFNWMEPDKSCIYGMDRFNCTGYEKWKAFRDRPATDACLHQYIRHCLVIPPPDMQLGARIAIREYGGYVPIGFFQAWHSSAGRRYPLNHGSAERTDVLHALQWPSDRRRKMPETFCVHLESRSDLRMGANWQGRRTPQFGPRDPFAIRDPGRLKRMAAARSPTASPGGKRASSSGDKVGSPPPVVVNVQCTCDCVPCCCRGYGYGPTPCDCLD